MKLSDRQPAIHWDESDHDACERLAPLVRQGCGSLPAPHVLDVIRDAADRQVRRRRLVPFVRLGYAAAALIAATLTGWLVLQSARSSADTRKGQLLDDALFLCDDGASGATTPTVDAPDLALRLLMLQGLDTVATPMPEAAEPPAPPSTDSQSGNMRAPRAQRCG